jgi:hypothetical protein
VGANSSSESGARKIPGGSPGLTRSRQPLAFCYGSPSGNPPAGTFAILRSAPR